MDPLLPDPVSGLSGTTTRDVLLQKLKTGEWNYPEVVAGEANYSIVFDVILFVGFFVTWLIAQNMSAVTEASLVEADVKNFCLKGFLKGPKFGGFNKYVCFFTMEEVTTWVGAACASLIVLFKIVCGASKVNVGYVLFIAIGATISKFTRQGINGKTLKQVPTLLFLFFLILTTYAYCDVFGGEDDKSKKNVAFIFAAVAFWMAAVFKTYVSTINLTADSEELVQTLMKYDFAYGMTGLTTAIFGTCTTFFIFSELIFVSYASTRWYGIPFYFMYVIPVWSFMMVMYDMFNHRRVSRDMFNIALILCGKATLAFAHLHVCSFPGPDGKHVVEGCMPYGLHSLTENSEKFEYMDGSLTLPMVFSALFILMTFAGAIFSQRQLTYTLAEVCSQDFSEEYSGKTAAL